MVDNPYWSERFVGISISEMRLAVCKGWGWWDRGADLGSLLAQSAGSFISRLHNKLLQPRGLPYCAILLLLGSSFIRPYKIPSILCVKLCSHFCLYTVFRSNTLCHYLDISLPR